MKRTLLVAVLALAVLPVARALDANAIKEAAARVDAKRAALTVEALCAPELMGRRSNTTGGKKTTSWLAKAFEEAGLQKLEGQSSYVATLDGGDENVLGQVPGGDKAAEAIVFSAHWDCVGEDESGKLVPGADENASGLAAMLECARSLARSKPRHTLIFAAYGGWWDKEDAKRFRGAKKFLESPPKPKPIFEVELMMVGAPLLPSEPKRFFALGSESSADVTAILKSAAGATSELQVARASVDLVEKRGPRDGYDAFRTAKIPFLFLTSGVSKNYHKPSDVPATVDAARVAAAARFAIEVGARVDALDAAPGYAKESLVDDREDATEVLGLIEAALDDKSGIKLSASSRKALGLKRDKIKDMLDGTGPLHLEARERGVLKDSLELLLVCLNG